MQTVVQLFTLRAIEEPLSDTIDRVAKPEFDGVELVGLPDDTDAATKVLEDRAISVAGMHPSKATIGQNFGSVLRCCDALDCNAVVISHLDEFHSESGATAGDGSIPNGTARQFADYDLRLLWRC